MYEYNAIIVSQYDGDTARADIDTGFGIWTKNQPLRLNGFNCPEKSTEEGKAALAFGGSIMPIGTRIVVKTIKDKKEKFGRWLAVITLPDGRDYGQTMFEAGHAVSYDGGARTQQQP